MRGGTDVSGQWHWDSGSGTCVAGQTYRDSGNGTCVAGVLVTSGSAAEGLLPQEGGWSSKKKSVSKMSL